MGVENKKKGHVCKATHSKLLQVIKGNSVAEQMKQGILKHAPMTVPTIIRLSAYPFMTGQQPSILSLTPIRRANPR